MLSSKASGFARKSAIIVRSIVGRSCPEMPLAIPYSVSPRATWYSEAAVVAGCGWGAEAAAGGTGGGVGGSAGELAAAAVEVVGAATGAGAGLASADSMAGGGGQPADSRPRRGAGPR